MTSQSQDILCYDSSIPDSTSECSIDFESSQLGYSLLDSSPETPRLVDMYVGECYICRGSLAVDDKTVDLSLEISEARPTELIGQVHVACAQDEGFFWDHPELFTVYQMEVHGHDECTRPSFLPELPRTLSENQ